MKGKKGSLLFWLALGGFGYWLWQKHSKATVSTPAAVGQALPNPAAYAGAPTSDAGVPLNTKFDAAGRPIPYGANQYGPLYAEDAG